MLHIYHYSTIKLLASKTTSVLMLLLLLGLVITSEGKNEKKSIENVDKPTAKSPMEEKLSKMAWKKGPTKADLGTIAEVKIPEGYVFADAKDTKTLMEMMQNPISGSELGLIAPESLEWFIIYEFSDIGYVKDDDKDKLDADAMLESIKQGTERGNEERKKRGWSSFKLIGWEQKPNYNPVTNNLEWAIRGEIDGSLVINSNTRILGRHGVMRISLVVDPTQLNETKEILKNISEGYNFKPSQGYAEYKPGDKIAEYGLIGLITGGAVVAASKTGLLGKLGGFLALILAKLGKLIIVAIAGIGGLIKSLFAKITGKKSPEAKNE